MLLVPSRCVNATIILQFFFTLIPSLKLSANLRPPSSPCPPRHFLTSNLNINPQLSHLSLLFVWHTTWLSLNPLLLVSISFRHTPFSHIRLHRTPAIPPPLSLHFSETMGNNNNDKSKRASSSKRTSASSSAAPYVPSATTSRFWQDVMSIDPADRPSSSTSAPKSPAPSLTKKKPPLGARRPPSKQRTNRTQSLRPFKCDLCSSRFERRGHLESHVETVHHHMRPHNCTRESCPKTFGHRSSLSRHIRNVHDNPNHASHKNKNKHNHSTPPPPPPPQWYSIESA